MRYLEKKERTREKSKRLCYGNCLISSSSMSTNLCSKYQKMEGKRQDLDMIRPAVISDKPELTILINHCLAAQQVCILNEIQLFSHAIFDCRGLSLAARSSACSPTTLSG